MNQKLNWFSENTIMQRQLNCILLTGNVTANIAVLAVLFILLNLILKPQRCY